MAESRRDEQGRTTSIDRRGFMETGAAFVAVGSAGIGAAQARQPADNSVEGTGAKAVPAKIAPLPKRVLGRTGVEVSMLNLGTWKSVGLDRILRYSWANGIRYVDTAKSYGSEPAIARWLQAMPETRKELFLVTKDRPQSPKELIKKLDERLATLQTDYLDLIFIHALGDHGIDQELEWAKSKEFKETAEAIRKSGKAKFVGFSSHHARRPEILQNAAKAGFVDAIMLQYSPWIEKDSALNTAIDACHKQGIGLISMKQVAGKADLDLIPKNAPKLLEKGLTPYQALLHAIWTDERISSVCVSMRNTDQVRENSAAARSYKPLTAMEMKELKNAFLASRPTLCTDCDGRCGLAAGTNAELGNLTRLLTYHEHHGYRGEARRLYGQLTNEAKNWQGADLEAARQACPSHLDFATLLPRAEDLLA